MMRKRGLFSYMCYIGAAAVILAAIALTALSFFLKDLETYISTSLDHIEKETGYAVSMDRIEWTFARGAGITIHNLSIRDTRHGRFLFTDKQTFILVSLLPLLKKEIEISRLILQSPEIAVSRKARNLDAILHSIIPPEGFETILYNIQSSLSALQLSNGRLTFTDNDTGATETLTGITIRCERTGKQTYTVSADARYPGVSPSGKLSLHTTLSALRPSVHTLAAAGTITLHNLPLSRLAALYLPDNTLPVHGGRLNAALDFNLKPDLIYDLQVFVNTSQLDIVVDSETVLKNAGGSADISFSSRDTVFSIASYTVNLPGDIQLKGSGTVSDLTAASPTADLTIQSNEIPLPALTAYAAAAPGPVWDNMTAAAALSSVKQGTFCIERSRYRGPVTTHVPTILSSCNGTASMKNIHIALPDQKALLLIPDAAVSYDSRTLSGRFSARILGSDNHTATFQVSPVYPKPSLSAQIDSSMRAESASELAYLLSLPDGLLKGASGRLYAQTTLQAKDRLRFSSRLDATDASCTIAGAVTKPRRVPAVLSLKGVLTSPRDPQLSDVSFAASLDNAASVSGARNPKSGIWELAYTVNGFRFERLAYPVLPPPLSFSGTASGQGTFTIPSAAPSGWNVSGILRIAGLSLHKQGKPSPLIHCLIDGAFHKRGFKLDDVSMRLGTSEFSGSGILNTIVPPCGSLSAHAPVFDIDDVVATITELIRTFRKYRREKPSHDKNPFFNTDLDIALTADRINFMSWDFMNGSSRYTYKNAVMRWEGIQATASPDNGTIHGSVVFNFKDHDNKVLRLIADKTDVSILWAIKKLETSKTIRGRMNLQGEFSSTYKKLREIIPNMTSTFHICITDGTLQKFTVLSKILSMLNIQRLLQLKTPDPFSKGMPFSRIESDFAMKESIMHTDNFILKSPAMNLSAIGDINLEKRSVDFTVGVQVLNTIAKIIGTIPYAGEKITGKNKTLTVGYFKVKGPFDSPSVTPQPLETLDSTIFNIFNSVMSIPLDLIDIPFKIYDHIQDVTPTRKNSPGQ